MRVIDVKQRSKEWEALKLGKIGGSKAKKAMSGAVGLETFICSIIGENIGDYEIDDFISEDMQRGIDLEPIAFKTYNQMSGLNFQKYGLILSENLELACLSPDGLTSDFTIGLEIKCPTAHKHISYIRANNIPPEYIYQVAYYFLMIPKLKELHFISYRPENRFNPIFKKIVNLKSVIGKKNETVSDYVKLLEKRLLKIQKEVYEYRNKNML